MSIAVFPGSFDPPTNGHLNIIQRASTMFDSIDVVIAVNSEKKYLFSQEERFSMLKELVKPYKNVTVHIWEGLIVNYAKKTGAKILLRGIRNTIDFSYEFELSLMNHNLNNEIETLFIPTDQKYLLLKSSSIKELARFGGNISEMVPPFVEDALRKKYNV
ncbi:MAG: pantetheine-phosphate adenylyltransferase [Treponema sp.]|jgi:pantetheine-phosphate adenylyltransferase|nr:pantetheine-phosphate adenylyltransferase [Treponema sp.]MBQ5646574.1 pantetheine-phosphate adenylyltransferase [Treponema sp.]MEE0457145.1 pantetheine-phosphate adenylyltransferase [Anaerovibrio sp.]MEE1058685.1 pantetheine-phosphate adenylyltransferase [Treponema sp.]